MLRADREVPNSIKRKVSLMCDVDEKAVVAAVDAPSIYDIPKVLFDEGLDSVVMARLGIENSEPDWTQWHDLLDRVHNSNQIIRVAMVGKYVDLPDAYLSVAEALRAGGFANRVKIEIKWVASDDCATAAGAKAALSEIDAICVPGGFGVRGIEGKLGALKHGRETGIPTLGLCLGLQCMVIEIARNKLGLLNANSTEFDAETTDPVIATMVYQVSIVSGDGDLGASMRLGSYEAKLTANSLVKDIYGQELIT